MASASNDGKTVLIFVAPADGSGGVGDYAEHVLADVRGMFDEVHEIRTHGPGEDGLSEIRAWRRRLRQLERRYGRRNVVVHAELSSGSVGPLWVLKASRAAHRSAVIHDAPLPTWWPIRVREVVSLIDRHWEIESWFGRFERRIFGRALRRMETRALRGVDVFALSDLGAEKIAVAIGSTMVHSGRHYIPVVPPGQIVPIAERPLAVGLFGHVYGGKGFELLSHLRVELPDEIEIRVAGRGTEKLRPMRGVTLLGPVDDDDERDFFNSIRILMLPYNRLHGREPVYPASGAAARAFAFQTPVVATRSGTFDEAAGEGGLIATDDVDALAAAVVALVDDTPRLAGLQKETRELAERRTISASLEGLIALWAEWISAPKAR